MSGKPQPGRGKEPRDSENEQTSTLRLYVTGTTPKSVRAIEDIRRICENSVMASMTWR